MPASLQKPRSRSLGGKFWKKVCSEGRAGVLEGTCEEEEVAGCCVQGAACAFSSSTKVTSHPAASCTYCEPAEVLRGARRAQEPVRAVLVCFSDHTVYDAFGYALLYERYRKAFMVSPMDNLRGSGSSGLLCKRPQKLDSPIFSDF